MAGLSFRISAVHDMHLVDKLWPPDPIFVDFSMLSGAFYVVGAVLFKLCKNNVNAFQQAFVCIFIPNNFDQKMDRLSA